MGKDFVGELIEVWPLMGFVVLVLKIASCLGCTQGKGDSFIRAAGNKNMSVK